MLAKITELDLALRSPFTSAKGTKQRARQVLLTLEHGGLRGHGTAVVSPDYGADRTAILEALGPALHTVVGVSPSEYGDAIDRLSARTGAQRAAAAAIDMALHDLLGKAAGLPLHRMLGAAGSPPPSALTLGAGSPASVAAQARASEAWPILKLKVAADLSVARSVRRVFAGRIWVDANGAWGRDEAVRAAEVLAASGVELLEQPVAAGSPATLRYVRERSPIPVVADEDCVDLEDVRRLAGCVDVVNVKLVKCGGIRRALAIIAEARAHGMQVLLGCKPESVLGVTAVAQLAALADHLDADGHFDVLDDPFAGVDVRAGAITLPAGPGLGVTATTAD